MESVSEEGVVADDADDADDDERIRPCLTASWRRVLAAVLLLLPLDGLCDAVRSALRRAALRTVGEIELPRLPPGLLVPLPARPVVWRGSRPLALAVSMAVG